MEESIITRIIRAVKGDMVLSKKQLAELISQIKEKAYNDGLKKGIERGRKKGYNQCLSDYGLIESCNDSRESANQHIKRNVDYAIIFIKADRGASVVKEIKEMGCLSPNISEQLYNVAQKLWLGRESYYNQSILSNLFNYSGSKSEFGPEYDSIALLVNLEKVRSVDVSDSFKQHEFFISMCDNKCKCINISNRIPLTNLKGLSNLIDL